MRRPIVRLCLAFVMATLAAATATLAGALVVCGEIGVVALAALAGIWAKWRFDPRRLPVLALVPFVLVFSLIQGQRRAWRIMRRGAGGVDDASPMRAAPRDER